MLFDSFTTIAQLINFLLLVWLLKRFLYKPVLRAIDAREQRLRDQQQLAQQQQLAAQQQLEKLRKQQSNLEQHKQELFTQAHISAEKKKQQLFEDAHRQIHLQRQQWQKQLSKEQQIIQQEMGKQAQQEIIDTLRQVLTDLADISLEKQLCHMFIKKLTELTTQQRQAFTATMGIADNHPCISSSFIISVAEQKALRKAVNTTFANNDNLSFTQDESIICGIELTSNNHKISWNIASYVDKLQQQLQQTTSNAYSTANFSPSNKISHIDNGDNL